MRNSIITQLLYRKRYIQHYLCNNLTLVCRTCQQHYSSADLPYMERPYVPRRTLMYVPGHDLKKLRKIPQLGVDCAVLECEDGVALNKKTEARENVRLSLDELDFKGVDCAVRVNSVNSGLVEEDLKIIMTAVNLPHTILLPKVDLVEELIQFSEMLRSITSSKKSYCPYLITYVESAQGLMNMRDVLRAAIGYSRERLYLLDGVVFGSDDFCADIGAARTTDSYELTYARQKVVTVAKSYRIQAIDMVHIDIKDTEGLRLHSEAGARMGFTGKQIIHPSQVMVVRNAFTPSSEKVRWATDLVSAFEQHQESGKGAFTWRGNMIDMPLLRQAKNVLEIIQKISS